MTQIVDAVTVLGQLLGLNIEEAKAALVVRGRSKISAVASAVSPSIQLFQRVVELGADLLIMHHDLGNAPYLTDDGLIRNILRTRQRILKESGLSLFVCGALLERQPLTSPDYILCSTLALDSLRTLGQFDGIPTGLVGNLLEPMPLDALAAQIQEILGYPCPLVVRYSEKPAHHLAVITGGGFLKMRSMAASAVMMDIDTLLLGEPKEPIYAMTKETGINLIVIGHYNGDRLGMLALGKEFQNRLGVLVSFVDDPCPI